MKKYKICEIFSSVQGEGSASGTPTIFIRFFGCNLACNFCDEPLHKISYVEMSEVEIQARLQKFKGRHITLTGGEPTLYNLNTLIKSLKGLGYYVSVETNGFNLDNIIEADYIVCSPKGDFTYSKTVNEYKFIINRFSSLDKVMEGLDSGYKIYIQPENGMETINGINLRYCLGLLEDFPNLKLSVQLHKLIGVR
mgnify:CR=1 FL=1